MLRASGNTSRVFGAIAHEFSTREPLTETAVGAFESTYRVSLPPGYRDFLLCVGNGGAGPGYGLFALGEMDDSFAHKRWSEEDGFVGILSKPFPHCAAWNDLSRRPEFDGSRVDDSVYEDEYGELLDLWEETYWDTRHVNGAMPICHMGRALRKWIVVTGDAAGTVWDDLRVDQGGLRPCLDAAGSPAQFLSWYIAWLEEALQIA